jgi:signal transduction histidine kinase
VPLSSVPWIEIAVTVAFIVAGIAAMRVRPGRVGPLMIAIGVLWAATKFPLPLTIGERIAEVLAGAWAAVLAHLVVAHPSGRIGELLSRALVAGAYLCAAAVGAAAAIGPAAAPVFSAALLAAAVVGSGLIGRQLLRLRWSTVARRRTLQPVLGAAVIAVALVLVLKPAMIAGIPAAHVAPVLQAALAAVPLASLVSMLNRRVDRARVAELVVRLHGEPWSVTIESALAQALHDPTLRVGYREPATGRYVDGEGVVVAPPAPEAADRTATRIERNGEPLALLLHDPALLEHRKLVEAVCAAMALALENEQLTAELRAQLRRVSASRVQVLRAAEAERRRLERDLHDGVQQKLLAIPMALSLAESALPRDPARAVPLITEAKNTAQMVVQELRGLSQGLHPPVLTERGLGGAVEELVLLAPLPVRVTMEAPAPLPAEVETAAYFIVSEALANLAKHARAQQAEVVVVQKEGRLLVKVHDDGQGGADPDLGSGLRGLGQRTEALGGEFHMDSRPGSGTTITAVLPCA